MKEKTVTKTITEKTLELDQEDIEVIIKNWTGDSVDAEWEFKFDFDDWGEIVARIRITDTEVAKDESS